MTVVTAPPFSPYKGLAAFADTDLDSLFFFGREREREVLVANLLASRVTVLYGASGVGKSSLLAAAVARDLRATAPDALVTLLDTWSAPVEDALAAAGGAGEAYLILDQFEECFLYHGDADEPGSLLHVLPELLDETRVNVLIALREDALGRLDIFRARIPSVFANQVRLEHLDRAAGRRAVLGPLDRWNEVAPDDPMGVESELVEAVLDECAVGGSTVDRIEAPYLQLVLERIWESERACGSRKLRLETLQALGGAETIMRQHLHGALVSLAAKEQAVAATVFEHLVTPSGTKIAHRARDLADYAAVPEDAVQRVLATLERDRIVHSIAGTDRYEIFHDVLAEPIRDWRQQWRLERERARAARRHRRLLAFTVLSLCALASVGALAGWALSERGAARSQARAARAHELGARALQQLTIDPNHGLALALAASRLEAGATAEAVLRQALIADRLRLVKHTPGPVRAIATSPRGDLAAAAVSGGRVLLLEMRNRRLVRTIQAPRAVAGVAFAAGGRTLITSSAVGLAQVWDVRDGRRLPIRGPVVAAREPDGSLRLVRLHGPLAQRIAHVRRLTAADDGSAVAAEITGPDGHVRAWLFDGSGRLVRILPPRGVDDVEFSPTGGLVATATADGFTSLWNARSGAHVHTFVDSRSGVAVVAFSPDGTQLASGGGDSGVRVWNVATGERTFLLLGHTNPVSALAWSPDGSALASASPDRTVLLWRMRGRVGPGSLAATLAGIGGPVRALAFSVDGTELVTGSDDRTVRFWDARPDEELRLLGRDSGPALATLWTRSSIVTLWRKVVKTYDPGALRVTHVLRAGGSADFAVVGASADGSVIAAGSEDGTTSSWNGESGTIRWRRRGDAPVSAIAVSPRGELVAAADRNGVVRVWESRTGTVRWSGRVRSPATDLVFDPRGDELAATDALGATIWSTAGRRLFELRSPGGAAAAAFSPDGRLIATAGLDATARMWFTATGNLYRVLRGHAKALTDVAFSANSRLLATSSDDSDGRVWQVARGLGHVLQRASFGPLSAIAFDPSGKWIAGAAPISVILWNAASGRQLFYLRGHKDRVTGISFAPDTATIASSSLDGSVRTYSCGVCVGLPALVHMAEVRLAQTR